MADPAALRTRHVKLAAGALALASLALLLAPPPAVLADALTPESGGSQNADDIDGLYKIVLYVAIPIFLIVEGTLIYSLIKFRARRGGPEPAQIRGNTPLELGWTIAAALILVLLTAITFVYLGEIKNPPPSGLSGTGAAQGVKVASIDQPQPPGGRSLNIRVNGQQYLWRYDYPGRQQLFSYHRMVVPVNTTVTLEIGASDVIHSWWIPKLGGKADAVPGHTNETWFKISKPGVYRGQCAELCGDNHADMRAEVQALPVAEYEAWAARQRRSIRQAQRALAAQRRSRQRSEERAAAQ